MGKKIDLINTKFGKDNDHTVLKETEYKAQGSIIYQCKCGKCGNEDWYISARRIKHFPTLSCGCLDNKSIGGTKHGFAKKGKKERFYGIWSHMKERGTWYEYQETTVDNRTYIDREIKCCDRWQKFENFKEDMYDAYVEACNKYGEKNVSIDRINPNGDYEPNNCRWANPTMQSFNQDSTKDIANVPILATRLDDGYKIITYNAKMFSRLVFGTPNHHIIDVCKGNRRVEKGWKFEYIGKEHYSTLKAEGINFIENLYNFKLDIPYHTVEEDVASDLHNSREDYKESISAYYINLNGTIAKGIKSEIYQELGFESLVKMRSALYNSNKRVRKLNDSEITLHLQGHQINF